MRTILKSIDSAEHGSLMSDERRLLRYYEVLTRADMNALVVVDVDGLVCHVSDALQRMLGLDRDALVGTPLDNLVVASDKEALQGLIDRAIDADDQSQPVTLRFINSTGATLIVEVVAGRLDVEEPNEVVIGMRDVTARVRAQESLRETQDQLDRAQRVAHVASWEVDTRSDWVWGTQELFRIYSFPISMAPPLSQFVDRVHPDDREAFERFFAELRETDGPTEVFHRIVRPAGDERMLHMRGESERFGDDRILFGTTQDITYAHRMQDRLRRGEKQLRSLTQRLHEAQEEERKRMAREVHDILGQSMTAIRMDIAYLQRHLSDLDPETNDRIAKTLALVEETTQTVRRISHELRPGVLDHFGLAAALEWQSEQFCERSGIACSFREGDNISDLEIPSDIQTALFRIFQEALTNVARHAGANTVKTTLDTTGRGELRLVVQDDGCGLSESVDAASSSLGVLNMRERVMPFRGNVEITGESGAGTTVTVLVPLQVNDRNNA